MQPWSRNTGIQMGGGKGSAPDAPDYMALADKGSKAALDLAKYNTTANRVNQINPYGSSTFRDNGNGQWTQIQSLSPQQQQIFNTQQNAIQGAYGNAQGTLSNPTINMDALPQAPINAGQTAQDAIMSRLQPSIERQRSQLQTQLQNQGFNQSSEGYGNAMTDQNQRENDLLNQAALTGINADMASRGQELGIQQAAINTPINAINALKGGNQTGAPTSQAGAMPLTQPADYLGAAMQQYNTQMQGYNAQQAQSGNMFGGLMGLGGSLGSAAILASDIRVKRDISGIGQIGPYPVYAFRYTWDADDSTPHVGVMAQDVLGIKPDAVVVSDGGVLMVDYGRLF